MRGNGGTKGQKGQRFLTSPHARARVSRDSLPPLPLAAPAAPWRGVLDPAARPTPSDLEIRPPGARRGVASGASGEPTRAPVLHNGPVPRRDLRGPSPSRLRAGSRSEASPFCNADREGAG